MLCFSLCLFNLFCCHFEHDCLLVLSSFMCTFCYPHKVFLRSPFHDFFAFMDAFVFTQPHMIFVDPKTIFLPPTQVCFDVCHKPQVFLAQPWFLCASLKCRLACFKALFEPQKTVLIHPLRDCCWCTLRSECLCPYTHSFGYVSDAITYVCWSCDWPYAICRYSRAFG